MARLSETDFTALVEKFDGEHNRTAHDLKAVSATLFVHRVGVAVVEFTHGVKEHAHSTVLGIDNINR
jgi:hypothetical protein